MSQQSSGRPLPAYVYRRRRLAVFGGLGIVLLLILLVTHPWSSGAQSGNSGTQTVIPATASAAPTATASGSGGGATAPCDPEQVKVSAYTDAESYAAGQYPQLTMEVENVGSEPCVLNVGTSQQQFTITSATEPVWYSTDCQKESSDYDLTLEPGESVKSEPIQWDRTRSNPGTCTLPQRDPVAAGGAVYHLTASVDGISSAASSQFTLN